MISAPKSRIMGGEHIYREFILVREEETFELRSEGKLGVTEMEEEGKSNPGRTNTL